MLSEYLSFVIFLNVLLSLGGQGTKINLSDMHLKHFNLTYVTYFCLSSKPGLGLGFRPQRVNVYVLMGVVLLRLALDSCSYSSLQLNITSSLKDSHG